MMPQIYTVIALGPDKGGTHRDSSLVANIEALTATHAAHRARMEWATSHGCGDGDIEVLAVFLGRGEDLYVPSHDEAEHNLNLDAKM